MAGLPKLNSPTYELTIPSTGKRVTYRPYLVKEEKILLLALESEDERQMVRAIRDIVTACTESQVDTSKIPMFDLEYIFTQLRAKSVGESVQVGMKCPSCNHTNEVSVNLENVYTSQSQDISSTVALTDSIGVKMKYPSVDTVLESRSTESGSAIDQIFDLLVECIDSIYSGDEIFDASAQSKSELMDFIESLNSEQFSKIRNFAQNIPSAQIDVSYKCSECGETTDTEIRGMANFFG